MQACRTCLSRYDLSPLFDNDVVVKFSIDQLYLITGVKIEPNDGLPQSACRKCRKTISEALELRELSSQVDHMFRSIVRHNIVVKVEPYDSDTDNILENNTNAGSSLNVLASETNNDISSNNGCIFQKNNPTKADSNDMKEYLHFKEGCSYRNIFHSNKEDVDVKPKLKKKNNKYKINKMSTKKKKNIINYNSEDSDCLEDSMSLSTYEESVDIKPLNDNIKQENDKYERNVQMINNDDESNFQSNLRSTKQFKQTNDECEKTQQQNISTESFEKIQNHFIKQITDEALKETDSSGKLSDIRIEDYISQKEIDELFNAESFKRYTYDIPKKPFERLGVDLNKLDNSGRFVVDRREKYSNNSFYYKMKKQFLNGRQIRMIDRRTEEINEKYKKLMELAVKPYHKQGPIQCKVCHSRLRNITTFRCHAKTHFEPEFTCEFQNCNKKFNSRNHMAYHQQRMHGVLKRLACSQCPYRAVDRPALRNHERAEHTGERPYVCDECGASFRMRNNIIQHMSRHFGVKNIQCEFCPKLFTRRSQLWTHQNSVHFLTYTYHCYLCPETYKGVVPVRNHLAAVHGVPHEQQLKIQCVKTRKDEANTSGTKPAGLRNQRQKSR